MDLKAALKIFGLNDLEGLDSEALKVLYKTLAKQKHPDRASGSSRAFVQLQEAYSLLQQEVIHISPTGRYLQTLSKEQILEAYYRDVGQLQIKLNSLQENSQETLQKTKQRVEEIISQFQGERFKLQQELEKKVNELEKKFNKNLMQKLLFFLPSMSEEEFWKKYEGEVQKYSRLHAELDLEFFKKILTEYGNSLNQISQILGLNGSIE